MQTIDRPSSPGISSVKMMVYRILTSSLVFMLSGISLICEARPPKLSKLCKVGSDVIEVGKYVSEHPDQTKNVLSIVAVVLAVLLGIGAVIMLIKYVCLGIWKLIKYVFLAPLKLIKFILLGSVVHSPRK